MVSSRSVWASAAQYLNDAKEFRLALDLARSHLSGLQHRETDPSRRRFLEYLRDQFERMENLEVCIFSLSEVGDLLSQWRGYCPANGGYSIGFSGPTLKQVMAPQGGFVAACVYDMNMQQRLVVEALAPVVDSLPATVPEEEEEMRKVAEEYAAAFFDQMVIVAPLVKHSSFSEEREWRLIWIPARVTSVALRFRAGRGTFVPYVQLALDHGGATAGFEEIIVGPMPHQDMASRALSGFLAERAFPWRAM